MSLSASYKGNQETIGNQIIRETHLITIGITKRKKKPHKTQNEARINETRGKTLKLTNRELQLTKINKSYERIRLEFNFTDNLTI